MTRYEDVRTVLAGEHFTRDLSAAAPSGQNHNTTRTVNMDGRPHLELRSLVSKAFTVRRIEGMRPRIQQLTDELLDEMERHGPPADLVRHLAAPLPAIAMCDLLGFPTADHERLNHWCDGITAVPGTDAGTAAWRELGAYVNETARAKRAEMAGGRPADADLLSVLIRAHDDAGRLTHEELVLLVVVVLAGGLETTQTAIGAGLIRLLRNPDQLKRLHDDPRLLDPAIDEILRHQPVIDLNRVQVATGDIRLGGQLVRAGDLVQISINSANHDETVFPESNRFEIARHPNPHIAFGHGAHHCLGAALARLELQTAFSTILRRFPRIDLAVPPESLRWRGGHVSLGLAEVPVTW
ncbi:cytochrome P450 [Polymorphospora sp. NPDC051019]|uniref:cytochrome P450 n=1 Tax=Polymorphospora sp. NPDC051019 TaxID=3155725 RepID=UPI003414DA64